MTSATCDLSGCTRTSSKVTIPHTTSTSSTPYTLTIANVRNAASYKPISDFTIALKSSDNYQSLTSSVGAWTNNAQSTFTTTVTSTDGYRGENAVFTFSVTGMTAQQKYLAVTLGQFTLVSVPAGSTHN